MAADLLYRSRSDRLVVLIENASDHFGSRRDEQFNVRMWTF